MKKHRHVYDNQRDLKNSRRKRGLASICIIGIIAGCQAITENQISPTLSQKTHTEKIANAPSSEKIKNVKTANKKIKKDKPSDLWEVVRAGLSMDTETDNSRIRAELKLLKGNQYYFNRLIKQAQPYLYYIVTELNNRNLPMEIALLPALESSYDPYAYSQSRAAGLWQFLPYIGKHYGLKQNWWYDGRRDVVESTRAALFYLNELYESFDDWELALAAYNAGRGRVTKAIKANQRAGKPTQYWHLSLPRETVRYVPKLIALSQVILHPEKYDIKLPKLAATPYFEIIDTKQQIDLARVASISGISLEEIQLLNPAFNRWATAPEGPHRLLLPAQKAKLLNLRLQI